MAEQLHAHTLILLVCINMKMHRLPLSPVRHYGLRVLKFQKKIVKNGVAKAVHRGRFEHIKTGLAKNLAGKDIYLDGGIIPRQVPLSKQA